MQFNPLVRTAKRAVAVVRLYENPGLWFIDRLQLIRREPITYCLRNGVKLQVEAHTLDCKIINEVWVDRIYTHHDGFKISNTDIVVDIGAHKGIFTVFAGKKAKQGKIYAFEPYAPSYNYLASNCNQNGLKNVRHYNLAIGTCNSKVKLFIGEDSGLNSLIPRTEGLVSIEIPQRDVRQLLQSLPRIDFLKMGIEGMEFPVLTSLLFHEFQRVKKILLEYHSWAGDIGNLSSYLAHMGFTIAQWGERRMLYAWRKKG